jgi:hypothetical protein
MMRQSKSIPVLTYHRYIVLRILTSRSYCRSNLEQVLGIYESNEDFLPEIARAQYLQASVYKELGNINQGNKLKRDTEESRRKIMGNNYTVGSSEDDYDKLVNFWSR